MIELTVEKREETGKRVKRLLSAGRMPAVVYGAKEPSTPISFALADFERILRASGEASVLQLVGYGKPVQVLIHEVDRHPVTNVPRHADFLAIEKGAKVEVAVPLSFIGESAAVKAGASLVKVMHELEIEADPSKLPHEIEVDITSLSEIGAQIHVRDIIMPAGVTIKAGADDVVALIQEVKEEVEEVAAAPDMDAIEVEKKGKEEGEEAPAE